MSGETESDVSAFTVDSLHTHLRTLMDERDRQLAERFASQQRAIDEAFAAHEKLTNVQIAAAAKAVDAALAAAKEAVDKAEVANDKRFESVNEFRAQLADQAALFLPRTEYAANHQNLADRVTDVASRLDRGDGRTSGSAEARSTQRLDNGQLIAVVSTLIAAIAIAVTLILALNG